MHLGFAVDGRPAGLLASTASTAARGALDHSDTIREFLESFLSLAALRLTDSGLWFFIS